MKGFHQHKNKYCLPNFCGKSIGFVALFPAEYPMQYTPFGSSVRLARWFWSIMKLDGGQAGLRVRSQWPNETFAATTLEFGPDVEILVMSLDALGGKAVTCCYCCATRCHICHQPTSNANQMNDTNLYNTVL